jgi:hypothetical protein
MLANEHVELSYQRLERRVCSAKMGRTAWKPAFHHGRPRDCQRRGWRILPTKLGEVVGGVVVCHQGTAQVRLYDSTRHFPAKKAERTLPRVSSTASPHVRGVLSNRPNSPYFPPAAVPHTGRQPQPQSAICLYLQQKEDRIAAGVDQVAAARED